jgi:hypothetical protein
MIRNGDFGDNFETKLYMTLVALLVCMLDMLRNKRKDYLAVFITGTLIWGATEYILQLSGMRKFDVVSLYNNELPLWTTALLRGTSEGATIALIGLVFGDLIIAKSRKTQILGWVTFLIFTLGIMRLVLAQTQEIRPIGGAVISRREMFSFIAVFYMIAFVVFDMVAYIKADAPLRKRAAAMTIILVIFASIWTLSEFFSLTRWIEVESNGGYALAPGYLTFLAFLYDIIVEIALCYLSFLFLPMIFLNRQQYIKKHTLATGFNYQ